MWALTRRRLRLRQQQQRCEPKAGSLSSDRVAEAAGGRTGAVLGFFFCFFYQSMSPEKRKTQLWICEIQSRLLLIGVIYNTHSHHRLPPPQSPTLFLTSLSLCLCVSDSKCWYLPRLSREHLATRISESPFYHQHHLLLAGNNSNQATLILHYKRQSALYN